jgi:hypothetical protein
MRDEHLRRVTAPGYLRGLDQADAAAIRAMRDDCRREERRLSYLRRLVQGHLDLALAEVARRDGAEPQPLIARVAHALTGPDGGRRSARAVGLYEPPETSEDEPVDLAVTELVDLDDGSLRALVDRLRQRERALSDQRSILLAHLDRLQDALVARYREGAAAIDEVAGTLGSS